MTTLKSTITTAQAEDFRAVIATLEATIEACDKGLDAIRGRGILIFTCYSPTAFMGLSQTGERIHLRQMGADLIRPFVRGSRREMQALADRWNEAAPTDSVKVRVMSYGDTLRMVRDHSQKTLGLFQELLAA